MTRSCPRCRPAAFRSVALSLVLVMLVSTTGCFGRFPLTKGTYHLNERVSSNEFFQTLTFWGLLVTLYPWAFIGDLIFLNPVQFWSGEKLKLGNERSSLHDEPRDQNKEHEAIVMIPRERNLVADEDVHVFQESSAILAEALR